MASDRPPPDSGSSDPPGSESFWKRSKRALGGKNFTFLQHVPKTSEDAPQGDPESDVKAAHSRRREQVRRAQRNHRERKEQYIKTLEREVIRLRDEETAIAQDSQNMRHEIDILKELLIRHGIPIPTSKLAAVNPHATISVFELPTGDQSLHVDMPSPSFFNTQADITSPGFSGSETTPTAGKRSVAYSSALRPPPPEPLPSKLTAMSIHPQSQSPLFNKLPTEIRLLIFQYACTYTDRLDHPLPRIALYYRPGYHYHKHIYTDLLQTCRRIYLETYLFPFSVNEHVFYCYDGPPTSRTVFNFEHNYNFDFDRYEQQPQEQRHAVREFHFFTQQFWLDSPGYFAKYGNNTPWCTATSVLARQCRPKKIKITLRYRDWWTWSEEPTNDLKLALHPFRSQAVSWREMDLPALSESEAPGAWGYQFQKFQGLQELEMEFETRNFKSSPVDAVVQHALAWKFPLQDGMVLSTEGLPVTQSRWSGFGDRHRYDPAPEQDGREEHMRDYYDVDICEASSVDESYLFDLFPDGQAILHSDPSPRNAMLTGAGGADRVLYRHPAAENQSAVRASTDILPGDRDEASWLHEHDHLADVNRSIHVVEMMDYYVVSVRWKVKSVKK